MKLFLVHCGFYDSEICQGIYESHVNFFVVADTFENARLQAKQLPEFQQKRMHIDGIQEINRVGGYNIEAIFNPLALGETQIIAHKHRDLAPKPPMNSL